jgi:hypothetical protein
VVIPNCQRDTSTTFMVISLTTGPSYYDAV